MRGLFSYVRLSMVVNGHLRGAVPNTCPGFQGLLASQIRRVASPCWPWMHLA